MAKGESIDALLSPSLRVSRPVAACSRCRSAKIKCDGKLPACTACERAGKASSCSGASDEFAKGKERSYVAALEATLERLQRRVAQARALQHVDPSTQDALAASYMLGPSHELSPRRVASGGRTHRKEASDVDNLVGDFGFLSVNATSRDFHGFTATMSFARLLLSISKTGDIIPGAGTRSLPPRYAVSKLVLSYLDNVFVLMPFFSETDLMASLSAVYAEAGRRAKPRDHWMIRMVLGIVAAWSTQEKGDSSYRLGQEHVAAALHYAEDVLHPGSIAGIQAILLLVQYSMLDPDLLSCWHLIGFASRVMVDLGLHNEPAVELRMTKEESEMRRKVFYCVYALDRNISMAFDRSFSFTDDSASVCLPAIPHSTIPPGSDRPTGPQLFLRSLRPSIYLFDIRRVQSALYQETHSCARSAWPEPTAKEYTTSILSDVRSWFSSIPDTLSSQHKLFFRLEFLYSQISALAPSSRIPNIPELSRIRIFEYSIQFADYVDHASHGNDPHAFFTFTDVLRLDFVGHQFLRAMWASFDSLISGGRPQQSPLPSPQENGTSLPNAALGSSPTFSRPTSGLENSSRAIRCLNQIIKVLSNASQRFGNQAASIKTKFEQESAVLLNKLKMKQKELGTVQYITGGPPPPPQRPIPQQDLSSFPAGPGQQLQVLQDPAFEMLESLPTPQEFANMPQLPQQHANMPHQPLQERPSLPQQHMSFPNTLPGQDQLYQQQQNNTLQPPQIRPPSLVRHLSHCGSSQPQNRSAIEYFQQNSAPHDDFALLPQGSLPRRSYEFLGGRRNEGGHDGPGGPF
jgi:Fungal specific transcription factor domain/Fungal Zn(2)-Cys(6) binuclear cluster domain